MISACRAECSGSNPDRGVPIIGGKPKLSFSLAPSGTEAGWIRSMAGTTTFIGRIRFRDIQYKRETEFSVRVDTTRSEVVLFLDQDVEGTGGFYSGECTVGLDPRQTRLLIDILQKAVSLLPETGHGPNVAARVPFKWSDAGAPEPDDSGIIVVASSGKIILGISPGGAPGTDAVAEPYLATFGYKVGEDLIAALDQGASTLGMP